MQNSFIDRHFSFDDHQSYAPVIEELVFYVKDWRESNPTTPVPLSDAITLVKFGSAFDVEDLKYWRETRAMVERALQEGDQNVDDVLDIATMMKDVGILSNKILKQVQLSIAKAKHLTSQQLALFTMIYASPEMSEAMALSQSRNDTLEQMLIKNLENFNSLEFSMVCDAIGRGTV